MRTRLVLAGTLLLALRPLSAQSSAPGPGEVVRGQVSVHVHVTLGDSADPYYPVADHPLILYRSGGDSVALRTDEVGVLRVLVAPGRYGLASAAPVEWHGQSYAWQVPIDVRAGMRVVDLTLANATPLGPRFAEGLRGIARAHDSGRSRPVAGEKSVSTAVVLNVLIPGTGQMYAGRSGKGAALLVGSTLSTFLGAAAAGASQSAGAQGGSNSGADLGAVAGIGVGVALWIYSIATAPGDVRAHNARR